MRVLLKRYSSFYYLNSGVLSFLFPSGVFPEYFLLYISWFFGVFGVLSPFYGLFEAALNMKIIWRAPWTLSNPETFVPWALHSESFQVVFRVTTTSEANYVSSKNSGCRCSLLKLPLSIRSFDSFALFCNLNVISPRGGVRVDLSIVLILSELNLFLLFFNLFLFHFLLLPYDLT